MRVLKGIFTRAAAIAALGISCQANATLVLNTGVTGSFSPAATTTNTVGNDLPGIPGTLYFGQLGATQTGFVDFFYVGNEAAYTNSLLLNHIQVDSSAAKPDVFTGPFPLVGSVSVNIGAFVSFGLCTSGGVSVGASGRCAFNDDASSLIEQYNAAGGPGYRSIAFRPLTSFNEATGALAWGALNGASNVWGVFWDDSGAKNDDNHDDYIAVARFRALEVPEPGVTVLLAIGLMSLALSRRRKECAAPRTVG